MVAGEPSCAIQRPIILNHANISSVQAVEESVQGARRKFIHQMETYRADVALYKVRFKPETACAQICLYSAH